MSDLASIISSFNPGQDYLRAYYGARQFDQNQFTDQQRLAQQKLYMTLAGLRDLRAEGTARLQAEKDLYTEQHNAAKDEDAKVKDAWGGLPDVLAGAQNPEDPNELQGLYSDYLKARGLDPSRYPTPDTLLQATTRSAREKRNKEAPPKGNQVVVGQNGVQLVDPNTGQQKFSPYDPQFQKGKESSGEGLVGSWVNSGTVDEASKLPIFINSKTGETKVMQPPSGSTVAPKGTATKPANFDALVSQAAGVLKGLKYDDQTGVWSNAKGMPVENPFLSADFIAKYPEEVRKAVQFPSDAQYQPFREELKKKYEARNGQASQASVSPQQASANPKGRYRAVPAGTPGAKYGTPPGLPKGWYVFEGGNA
jgi:hypothetical protein